MPFGEMGDSELTTLRNGHNETHVQPPNSVQQRNDSAGLMPPPPLGTSRFGGKHARPFDNSVAVDTLQDPRFGRKASGSLLDDDGDD